MNLSLRNTFILVAILGVMSLASTCGMKKGFEYQAPHVALSQMEVITVLAADHMEGREIGTTGGDKAAGYIADQMRELGLAPLGDEGSYIQEFTFKPISVNPHGTPDDMGLGQSQVKTINGKNVIGYLDNQATNTIVIGAHYDHLGYGNEFSLFKGDSTIHNGADDNASGIAAMLKIADDFSNRYRNNKAYNFAFVAFSGEEYGLIGSNYYCKNPTLDLTKVNCMLNFDMVGRLKEDRSLAVYGNGTSPLWTSIVESQNKDFKLVFEESGVGPSDHTSFYFEDIPVLHFFTGQHEDYHKPSDDISRINFEGLADITQFVEDIIIRLNNESKLEFLKTKESTSEEMSFKVTLGVVPDYMYTGEGMRIDGVTEGRPAANSGIEKGDIVIQIGENEVKDMMSYMECLGKYSEGETTKVKVKRGEEEVELDVLWD